MISQAHITKSSPAGSFICGACLVFMFLGAWTCDGAILLLTQVPKDYLALRLLSVLAYVIAFVLLFAMRKRFINATQYSSCEAVSPNSSTSRSNALRLNSYGQRFFARFLAVGAFLLLLGCALLLGLQPNAHNALPLTFLCIFLIKAVGPALSITLLLLFAHAPQRNAIKATALAYTVAFLGECLLGIIFETLNINLGLVLVLGAFLQCGGCILAARSLHCIAPHAVAKAPDAAPSSFASALSPLAQNVFSFDNSRGSIIKALVFVGTTALMLGFMKSGASSGNAVSLTAAIIVLIVVSAMVFCLEHLDIRALFASAIICLSAAVLLAPVIGLIGPHIATTLADTATILFEIFIWVIAIALVHAAQNGALRAASVRLATVIGHTTGALLAVGAGALSLMYADATQTASFLLLFIYIILLIVISRNPASPNASSASLAATSSTDDASTSAAAPDAISSAPATSPSHDLSYWTIPCETLARAHALTPRETEVLIQLAQGRDLAFMESKFVISRNTIKMHVRNVYAKLGVHSKQEVIDLVDQTRTRS